MISYPNCDPGTKQNRTRGTATRKVWAVVPSVLRLSQTWGEQGNVSTPYLYIYVYTILYTKTKCLKIIKFKLDFSLKFKRILRFNKTT